MSTGHGAGHAKRVTLPPGIDRLPSGALRVRVYGPDRKRRTVGTFGSEKAAKDALAKARTELLAGSYIEPEKADTTLDEWFQIWMPTRNVRANTLHHDWDRYRLHIKPHLGHLQLARITPYQVRGWLTALDREGFGPHTRKRCHALLSAALGVHGAVGDQRITVNPCSITRPPTPPDRDWILLDQPEFDRLLEHAGEFTPILLLAGHGGLRWSEIAGLQARDYNRTAKTLRVERAVPYIPKQPLVAGPTKSGKPRTIPLSPQLVDALNQHLKTHPTVSWMFPHQGGPMAPHHMRTLWEPVREAAGVSCRFHDLRHSCISWLLAGGASLADCRDFAGHSSITTTEKYLHTSSDRLRNAVSGAFG